MDFQCIIDWVYAHETLTAGFLGVCAASASVYMLNKQIKYQIKKDQADRVARRTAVRSLGLTLLIELNAHGLKCFGRISQLYDEASTSQNVALDDDRKLPQLEKQTLESMKEWIELEEPENQKKLIVLLENYQLLHSRFPNEKDVNIYKGTLKLSLLSSAVFLLITEECWQFVRQIRTSDPFLSPLDDRVRRLFSSLYENNRVFSYNPEKQAQLDQLKENIKSEYNYYMTD